MKKLWSIFLIGLLGWSFSLSGITAAADVSSDDQGVKKVGVVWNIAKDRKIENIGGLYQPEELDKYMRRLVDELSARIDQLIQQNGVLEQKIDRLLQQNDEIEQKIGLLPSRSTGATPVSEQPRDAIL